MGLVKLLFFKLEIDEGADEGSEEHVAFRLAGFGVDGGFGVGFGAFSGDDLCYKPLLPVVKFCELIGRRVAAGFGCGEDFVCALGSLSEQLVVVGFVLRERFFPEVPRVGEAVKFFFAGSRGLAIG